MGPAREVFTFRMAVLELSRTTVDHLMEIFLISQRRASVFAESEVFPAHLSQNINTHKVISDGDFNRFASSAFPPPY